MIQPLGAKSRKIVIITEVLSVGLYGRIFLHKIIVCISPDSYLNPPIFESNNLLRKLEIGPKPGFTKGGHIQQCSKSISGSILQVTPSSA